MLFILAVIAFLQMTCIPGFIALKYSCLNPESKLQTIVYTFALSLLINYLAVYLLTVLRVYKPITVYALLFIEMGLLLYYRLRYSKSTGFYVHFKSGFDSFKKGLEGVSPVYIAGLVLSFMVIAVFVYIFLLRIKAVFYLNDPVLGWNRFALDWFQNRLPVNTWYYPQLLPANWSLAYVIMQNADLQVVARNIMPLFSLFTTFLFLDLGLRKKQAVYFWALVFYGMIIRYFFRPDFIAGGHMDIPVAFFSFLAFYVLHLHHGEQPFQVKYAVLAVIFAATAAVAKQPGIYILIIIVAWSIRLLYKGKAAPNQKGLSNKTIIKTIAVMLLIIVVVVLSWYLFRVVLIHKGIESSGIKAVTQDVHHNRAYIERLQFGCERILHAGNKKERAGLFVGLAFLFLFFSLFTRKARNVTLAIILPYTVLWGLFYSYDIRNLTMAFPFMALAMAAGAHWFFIHLGKRLQMLPGVRLSGWHILVIFILLPVILNFTLFNPDALLKNQLTQQRRVGDTAFNAKLYTYYHEHGFAGKVFSKYPYFRYLPEFRDYWAGGREDKEVYYLLEDFNRTRKDILTEIKQKLKSGEYEVVFSYNQYRLIKIK